MKGKKYENLELTQTKISSADFIEIYNQGIPADFPQASQERLKRFQARYPTLFLNKEEWTVDKHRKKFMDWISSHYADEEEPPSTV